MASTLGVKAAEATRIGIIGAMPSEIAKLRTHVRRQNEICVHSNLTVVEGVLPSKDEGSVVPVCFCASGVGMVSAAMTVTVLVHQFGCNVIIFSGVAGGLHVDLKVGDVLVVKDSVHYEMDCSAWIPPCDPDYRHARGEIPFTGGIKSFPSHAGLCQLAMGCASGGNGCCPRLILGRLATGSEFLSTSRKAALSSIWEEVGKPLAVDMECAGAAQVCSQYSIPFLGLRAISDTLTGDANADFNEFTHEVADSVWPIIEHVARHASSTVADRTPQHLN